MSHLRPALVLLAAFTLLTGVVYPLLVCFVAQALTPGSASGSLVVRRGVAVGSSLIGQPSADPARFWGRPSATAPQPCNGASSRGSNLGPTNPALVEAVRARIATLRAADPANRGAPVPVDLVTASASGLDPHISPAAALYQVPRVARLRGRRQDDVRALVLAHVEARSLGFLGEPRVNVVSLNLALDDAERRAPTEARP